LLDVESALSALQHLDAQRDAQQENLTQSERAFEGARLRLRAGAADYLGVLDSQRTLYAARDQFSQYRLARLQAIVGLIKSLGGGWQQPDAVAQSR
jgi:outer membrane protein TolC